jgi:peptide/nickel transport system permease protein
LTSYSKFLVKRSLQGIVVAWGVITVLFGLRAVSPGDPVNLIIHFSASEQRKAEVRSNLGLDEPIYVQYLDYLGDVLSGDLGFSYRAGRDVNTMVIERLPATLELAIAATIIAVVIAIPLGVISATRRNQKADYGATLFSLVGISTPNFWLGIMLILLFSVRYGIPYPGIISGELIAFHDLPTQGREYGFLQAMQMAVFEFNLLGLVEWFRHIILPAITLGTYFTAMITRLTRSGMLDEYGKAYVTANEAKGLPAVLIRYKHVLRNTMIPIITVLGLQMGTLIGGAVITETVFNWPGLGERLITAIRSRDWPLIQGIIICIGVGFVIINIIVDATYAYLNPRVLES